MHLTEDYENLITIRGCQCNPIIFPFKPIKYSNFEVLK